MKNWLTTVFLPKEIGYPASARGGVTTDSSSSIFFFDFLRDKTNQKFGKQHSIKRIDLRGEVRWKPTGSEKREVKKTALKGVSEAHVGIAGSDPFWG